MPIGHRRAIRARIAATPKGFCYSRNRYWIFRAEWMLAMPIEFRCTGCQKLLRTKDDSAGKQARCPECGTLLAVPEKPAAAIPPAATPAASVSPPATRTNDQATPTVSDNPYLSPQTSYADDSPTTTPSEELRPTAMDVGETLLRTWRIFWRNRGVCVLATILFFILTTVPRIPTIQWSNAAARRQDWGNYAIWYACDVLLGWLIYAYVGAGMRLLLLKLARGEQAPLSTLFVGGRYYLSLLIGGLLFGVSLFLGMFGLLIGAVFAALLFWPYAYLIVDRNIGVIDAFRTSAAITAGNRLTVLATYSVASILSTAIIIIVAILAAIIGFLAAGFLRFELVIWAGMMVGGLFIFPYLLLLPTVMYLSMTGQPISEPRQQ